MRLPMMMLPSVMLLGVALALHGAGTDGVDEKAGVTAVQNEGALQKQQQAIGETLERLRAERRHVIVRGGI